MTMIIHLILPDSLDMDLARLFDDNRGQRGRYADPIRYEDWRHGYIVRTLQVAIAHEMQRLKEERAAIEEAKKRS